MPALLMAEAASGEMCGVTQASLQRVQALLSGCIPVFFNHYWGKGTFDNYLPLHFRWRKQASVLWEEELTPRAVEGADLVRHLQALHSSGETLRMQQAIATHAHQLVYSLDGYYAGDATDTLIRGLHQLLTPRKAQPHRTAAHRAEDAHAEAPSAEAALLTSQRPLAECESILSQARCHGRSDELLPGAKLPGAAVYVSLCSDGAGSVDPVGVSMDAAPRPPPPP